jgi:hypothetical protein
VREYLSRGIQWFTFSMRDGVRERKLLRTLRETRRRLGDVSAEAGTLSLLSPVDPQMGR